VHPESSDDKSHNRRRRRRSVYGMWIPTRENVPGVNVDTTLMSFAAVSASRLQQK